MPKVSVIILPYQKTHLIKPVFDAVFAQTHRDLEVIAVINDSADGSKEIIKQNYPAAKIIEPGTNLFFAAGNNIGISNSTGEFIQLVNDDLLLEPDYISEVLKAFEDPKVAAATGKLLRYNFETGQKSKTIDSTGVVLSASGRARDRGQLQQDLGQFDKQKDVFGVSGAGAMYRKSALEKVKFGDEYFDQDFVMYWEDVDLSWRLNNLGFKNAFVPSAVAYHGRTAGTSEGGYLHLWKFIKHHKKLNSRILKWNYKNHILMYIKNAKHIFHPAFVLREIAMLGYVTLFETSTLKVFPELLSQMPAILKKRRFQEIKKKS
ncbi:MAG TPA: glycosyltransferase family 2 protein [Patescibacteria group bacterium]|jgi:GT2 family glycosyltransferase|nr:glycosyltransferase family 2 protein [Patescibacteria group bacterium]